MGERDSKYQEVRGYPEVFTYKIENEGIFGEFPQGS